jgi:protein O-GlcNAc transferase
MRLLDEGATNEAAGRLQEALECYDKAIRLKPDFGRAYFNRGNILLELDDPKGALDAYASALVHKPDSAAAYFNSGNAYTRLAQHAKAVVAYEKALTLKPDFVDAEVAKGAVLQDLKRTEDAVISFRRALAIKPDYAEAHYNLGGALEELGMLEEAVTSLRKAIELKKDYTEAHVRLGALFYELGQFEAAAGCYSDALKIQPDRVEAHNNLAAALVKLGRTEAAVEHYLRALEVAPEQAEVLSNLGVIQKQLGRFDDAVASYRQALAINPDFAEAHNNLGTVLHKLGRIDEALQSYQYALKIDPENANAHNNLGVLQNQLGQLDAAATSYRRSLDNNPSYVEAHSNLGSVLADLGQLEGAAECYRRALEIDPGYTIAHSNMLFTHNYLAEQSSLELLAEAQRFGEVVAQKATPYTTWSNPRNPTRCLRIGIVSADLRQHPAGYFAENTLTTLARQAAGRLELFAYSNHHETDPTTLRIKASCHRWHDVYGIPDERLAQLIYEDGIDILIDLSGHTGDNRLPVFAWKPAPVQVSWLGYFATTGVAAIDYLIADPWTLPENEEASFSEHIWRLPETRLCFTPPLVDLYVSLPPALTNNYITFGCFNNLAKMNDLVVALWAQVLSAVPNSRLFLKARALGEVAVQQSVINRFAEHGIDPQRLILETYVPRANYLAAYNRVDIALDPFPYTGGTTTVEALWMGVPVLTLAGRQFLARQGVGLLMNAGLPEWVASDQEDYLSRAVAHASDLQRLASLRAGLRQQVLASPIFDAPRFARHFEAALRGMWEKWCRDQIVPPSEQTPPLSSVK